MRIIILTGSEIRHEYFRKKIASDPRISVLRSFCEGVEESLENRIRNNKNSSTLEAQHAEARLQSEKDFFRDFISTQTDESMPTQIAKGAINDITVVSSIIDLNPDLIVCYGASLIKSELLSVFRNRFLNIHLGLSPYYRGSGTNVWPLINGELDMVGATFMHIDAGIDSGEIIHQIRAEVFIGDGPHTIGNRLISVMTSTCIDVIVGFRSLCHEVQPKCEGKLYLVKDFDSSSCRRLYTNFETGMVRNYLGAEKSLPYIVTNKGLLS